MSTGADIILADATSPTPVNRTFSWSGEDQNGVSRWVDRSGGIPVGYPRIDISLREPKGSKRTLPGQQAVGVMRALMTISRPVMETLGTETSTGIPPAPTVAYVPFFTGEFLLPDRSVTYDRATLLKFVGNLCLNSQIIATIVNLDKPR